MAERISILTPGANLCPFITVNTAALSVPIPNMGAPIPLLSSDLTRYIFQEGDNFEVLSLGYFIPERFVLYDCLPGVGASSPVITTRLFAWRTNLGGNVALEQFGNDGNVKIPFPNFELSMGVFVDAAQSIGDEFYLQIQFPITNGADVWNVSMANVPIALNGQTFRIIPFVKVLHNFELTT